MGSLNAGLRDAVMQALGSEDPKLKVICAGIAITVASDQDDTPAGLYGVEIRSTRGFEGRSVSAR